MIYEDNNVLGDNKGYVKLIDSMGDDLRIVNAARVSYNRESDTFEEKDKKLLSYLLRNNHTSPLEQVHFTFIVNVPMFIERQWQRHRTWKYFSLNEVSRRYTKEDIQFYVPTQFRKQSDDNKQMSTDELIDARVARQFTEIITMLCEEAVSTYNVMIEHNVAREQARGVFPIYMYTKFYATVDLHNLLWFLDLREHPHAQWEVRKYAESISEMVKKVVPQTYALWKELTSK